MSDKLEYLIDQLDLSLRGEMSEAAKQQIPDDQQLAGEWQTLQVAVAAISEAGLHDQVAAVRKSWKSEQVVNIQPRQAVVRTMYRNVLRVAACVLLIAVGVSVYKYSTVNASSVYDKYYTSYDLNTTRSVTSIDPLEKAYRGKNWLEVINQFNSLQEKNNKSYFLTGMANLELKNYQAAIPLFSKVLENNTKSAEGYFQDESEYYLAMSYIGAGKTPEAVTILKKIKADKNHLYHAVVENMSGIDLSIIDYKSGK
jgi:tetratricopeptide (TPR) repeat protein